MPHAQQQSAQALVDKDSPKGGWGLADVVCEEPCEIGRVAKAEVLGHVRDRSRRIGQDALGFEHKPIMDDRLGRKAKLPSANAAEMRRRDPKDMRVEGERALLSIILLNQGQETSDQGDVGPLLGPAGHVSPARGSKKPEGEETRLAQQSLNPALFPGLILLGDC